MSLGIIAAGSPAHASPTIPMPVTPDHGVARAQIFDSQVPDKSVYDGKVDFVWGASSLDQPEGVLPSKYIAPFISMNASYDTDWMMANHPDWIEYRQDRTTPAWVNGHTNYPPFDFTNPQAREWFFDAYVQPAVDAGWKVIAFDHSNPYNFSIRAGHYDADGNWVQQYSDDQNDPAYTDDLQDWLGYLTTRLHSEGVAVAANVFVQRDPAPIQFAHARQIAGVIDIVIDEGGFVSRQVTNGISDGAWAGRFSYIRDEVTAGKSVVMIDETSVQDGADAPDGEIQYSVANYFLYKGPGTMLYDGFNYGYWYDRPELDADIGVALGDPAESSSGIWERQYSDGMTFVNPSSTQTVTVPLPAGTWTDLEGNTITGSVTLGPTTGTVLTAAPGSECTTTISGQHAGAIAVLSGVTCLQDATVAGSVTVRPGASLIAVGSRITGALSAVDANTVSLAGTSVGGSLSIVGAHTEATLSFASVGGSAMVTNGAGSTMISGSTIGGALACFDNASGVTNAGFADTVHGAIAGQCGELS
jgi:hypothetical protein